MNISAKNFVTTNEILSDVLKQVDDERMEHMTRGFYVSQIQQALEGLAFDTFFDERRESFDFPVDNLTLPMPVGAFNTKHVYLFNGTECDITKSVKVWYKSNYFTRGNGYFADNKGNNYNDPFIQSSGIGGFRNIYEGRPNRELNSVNNHYFYSTQNGMIMFSPACRAFGRVHLVYNGTGCDIGDIPIIPQFLREAVKDYVCEVALRIRIAKDRTLMSLWQIYEKRLNRDQQYGIGEGSWFRAEMRVKSMSQSEKSDMYEYFGSNQWQSGL